MLKIYFLYYDNWVLPTLHRQIENMILQQIDFSESICFRISKTRQSEGQNRQNLILAY